MNQEILTWMNHRYPNGFYCAEVANVFSLPISAIVNLNAPVLIHVPVSQLQNLITILFENGASPRLSCCIPDLNITGTIGDIALKVRSIERDEIFLVLSE